MSKLKIFEFLRKEYKGPKLGILLAALLSASSVALLIVVINNATAIAADASMEMEARLFLLYFFILALIINCKYYTLTKISIMVENVVRKIRVRLINKLRGTELEFIEKTNQGEIYARIAQDTDWISQIATDIANVFDILMISAFLYLYMTILSLTAFVFTSSFMLFLGVVFYYNYTITKEDMNAVKSKEAALFDGVNEILLGFKEIKMNTRKNDALFADIITLAEETEKLKIKTGLKTADNIVLAFIAIEGMLGLVVFVLPLFGVADSTVITKLVASFIFIFGMLNKLSRSLPDIANTNVAIENIESLEKKIDAYRAPISQFKPDMENSFDHITLNSVTFEYTNREKELLFALGPLNLTIRKGEIIFVIGGNGSGKSTLLKLLTGLYYPLNKGALMLDGQPVAADTYQNYRNLFSVIFTDFHLFKKLYGLESVDAAHVRTLLEEMAIHQKTDFQQGRFTDIDLSTGQRKRLAYIAAILEDKPIYVFDEWATDQDPAFRKHFYNKFLEDLRNEGKTVIAATHDDRYFEKADRVLKMEEGKIVNYTKSFN